MNPTRRQIKTPRLEFQMPGCSRRNPLQLNHFLDATYSGALTLSAESFSCTIVNIFRSAYFVKHNFQTFWQPNPS
jgi:hypothetical protein